MSFSANTGFLTRVEAVAAMETTKHTELFQAYAETSRPTLPKNKFKNKGRGDGRRSGRPLPVQLLPNPAAAQQQPPSASPLAPPASPLLVKVPFLLPAEVVEAEAVAEVARGRGSNA